MAWIYQWDIMAGIRSSPEKGYGQLNCGEPNYNCVLIGKALVPCSWMIWIVHAQNVYIHPVDDLCLAISLGMESCGLSEIGVQHWLEARPKCAKEPAITIWYDRLWDPKVHPHSFKEEFRSGFCCDIILASRHNGYLRESIDIHKKKKSLPCLIEGRKNM